MKKQTLIVLIVVILILLAGGAAWAYYRLQAEPLGRDVSAPEGELEQFSYSCGGNENGNSYDIVVTAINETQALLSYAKSEFYFMDPDVTEYLIDRAALTEIQAIFEKYQMAGWVGIEFTDMFVCDGETASYGFRFPGETVHFSSQIFPEKYWNKLKEIHDVIDAYKAEGTLLPALVLPKLTEEEWFNQDPMPEGEIVLSVCSYCDEYLRYRIWNGMEEDIEAAGDCALYLIKEDGLEELIAKEDSPYPYTIYAQETDEDSIRMEKHLEAGRYRLEVDDYSAEFEIR